MAVPTPNQDPAHPERGCEVSSTECAVSGQPCVVRAELVDLHAVTMALARETDLPGLCRRAVELGTRSLGLSRIGLWFTEGDGTQVRGSFGTDEAGNPRDESGVVLTVAPGGAMAQILDGSADVLADTDAPLRDGLRNVVGRGTNIAAAIWDGEQVVGCLCGDDLLRPGCLAGHRLELARLYAQSIGHLYSRLAAQQSLRESEERLRQAQRMESVGRLAGGIAHGFNNALAVILGRAEMGRARLADAHPAARDFDEILRAAHRSLESVKQLLTFARQQTPAPRSIDLNAAIERVLGTHAGLAHGLSRVVWDPAAELPPVLIDPAQLEEALIHLLRNAREAAGEQGEVTVATRRVRMPDSADGWVQISVSDDGPGIAPEQLEHVFEPFYTSKPFGSGAGLGLAIVYGVVTQNGGTVTVESTPGAGTTFRIHLHTAPADGREASPTPLPAR